MQDAWTGNHPEIISVFCVSKYPGMVYVEAYSVSAMEELCRNKLNVFLRKSYLVPVHERRQLLSVAGSPRAMKGEWAQIKSGRYRHDVGHVVVEDADLQFVVLEVVPRVEPRNGMERLAKGIRYKPAR